MTTYELAKELKDAGFPVKEYGYAPDIFVGGFVAPTLSELIEACPKTQGGGSTFLGKDDPYAFEVGVSGEGWMAGYRHWEDYLDGKISQGTTPEEAVARLYLALNKKS